ncbi:MAG: hypothetical protein HZY76_11525 [Anaerolineae bacterium]|nr:MAG: hypothetical protein HZY76_11525 [Anaerolineae bacterium]
MIGPVPLDDNTCTTIVQAAPDVVILADERPESAASITLTAVLMERFPNLRVIKTGLDQTTLRSRAADLAGQRFRPDQRHSCRATHQRLIHRHPATRWR